MTNDNILKNCDVESVRSLNGSRVADNILKLVPNIERYRTTLRCIKLWAKSRGIYSNILGYFGGVSWMILVAKICMMCPYLEPNKLLYQFFLCFTNWEWNYSNPISLVPIENQEKFGISKELLYVENRKHLMPILTPAFPTMNSTHNVSLSTKQAMLTEM